MQVKPARFGAVHRKYLDDYVLGSLPWRFAANEDVDSGLHLRRTHGIFVRAMLRPSRETSATSFVSTSQTWFSAERPSSNIAPYRSEGLGPVKLVPYSAADRDGTFDLLHELPLLYPGGAQWLETRLQDVLAGKADCTVAKAGARPVGILIGTPKGKRRVKLSTIYVHPDYRRRHLARALLDMYWIRWAQQGFEQVTVTVRANRLSLLSCTLKPYGFGLLHIEPNRYGDSQDEAILTSALGCTS